jgi:hypothetical protein
MDCVMRKKCRRADQKGAARISYVRLTKKNPSGDRTGFDGQRVLPGAYFTFALITASDTFVGVSA